jgi:hypothetical protein
MIPPVFHVSSFEELSYQVKEPLISDPLASYSQQGLMMHMIKETLDVALDPPSRSGHISLPMFSRCMTTPFRSEAMGSVRERWFIDGFQDKLEYRLEELISEARNPERSEFPVGLRYVYTTDWTRDIP